MAGNWIKEAVFASLYSVCGIYCWKKMNVIKLAVATLRVMLDTEDATRL